MKHNYPTQFFVCLVSYENTGKETDFIPPNCWGAVGWIAVDAEDENELRKIMKAEFDFMNLKLLDIEEVRIVNSPKEIEKRMIILPKTFVTGSQANDGSWEHFGVTMVKAKHNFVRIKQ